MIRAVLWDSDNTLVDTAAMHWGKHYYTLAALGIQLDDTYRERIYTNNGQQNWLWLRDELGLAMPEAEYLDRIDRWYFDHIDRIEMRPGIETALGMIKKAGIPQAVVSNGRRRSVMAALNAKNITPFMQFILCKEDYEGRKPAPTPYLSALARMDGVQAGQCLAIEDDPKGVESAASAGMIVIHRTLSKDQPPSRRAAMHAYETEAFLNLLRTAIDRDSHPPKRDRA